MKPEERLKIPSGYVYVHKNDLKRLENGELAFVYIEPEGYPSEFEKVKSAAFMSTYKIDNNKYEVSAIMK